MDILKKLYFGPRLLHMTLLACMSLDAFNNNKMQPFGSRAFT